MRIAHFTDCYLPRLGGIELQVHDLAQRQAAAGHEVSVITSTVADFDDVLPSAARVIRVASGGKDSSIRYRHSRRGLRALDEGKFDIVHVHASSWSPLAYLTAREASRRGIPTAATVHSLWAKATPLFRISDMATRWGDWPIAWSAVSNAAAIPLRRAVSGRTGVTILPNGIDQEFWRLAETPPPMADVLRVVVVARLAPRKRPLELLKMLDEASRRLERGRKMTVEIIGDGPERKSLEHFLRRHHMTGWVNLTGRLTRAEIRSTFSGADILVAPARLESFGIAALEARCAGLGIVARSGTGVEDFVVHGRDGWLVDSDNAMVDTIVSLANDRSELDAVTLHNRSHAPSISWISVLVACEELYEIASRAQGVSWSVDSHRAGAGEAVWGR